jgi:putative transposase
LQYYSGRYKKLLGAARISMSENSDPVENAIAERVNGTLKDELLDNEYESYREAAMAVGVYNHLRPHSSVEMLTPPKHTRKGFSGIGRTIAPEKFDSHLKPWLEVRQKM